MKNKLSQYQRIEKRLLEAGYITRNQALKNYISRLSAHIQKMEEKGWEFSTEETKTDYIYKVIKSPYKIREITLENGEKIKQIIR